MRRQRCQLAAAVDATRWSCSPTRLGRHSLVLLGALGLLGCTLPAPVDSTEEIATAPRLQEIRVGVEFVAAGGAPTSEAAPAAPARATESVRDEAVAGGPQDRRPPRPPIDEEPRVRDPRAELESERGNMMRPLSRRQIAELPTATERVTFRMLHSLVGQDGDRLPRELGWSFLQRRLGAADLSAQDSWADGDEAALEEAMQDLGPRLMAKPLRNALRELPLVHDVEVWVQDFKQNNVPTSGAWLDSRDEDRRRYGHLSLRVRADSDDPVRVTYALHGWRFGVSRESVGAGFATPLGDGWWFAIGSSFDHVRNKYDAVAELKLEVSAGTRVLFSFGNQMNPFPGATLERESHEELDNSRGAMVYVETIF